MNKQRRRRDFLRTVKAGDKVEVMERRRGAGIRRGQIHP